MKIERMNKGEWGKLRAFFDLKTSEGIVINGFKLVEGINGMFVGMPSQKGKDDEFFDTVFMDRDIREELNQVAMDAYNNDSFMYHCTVPTNSLLEFRDNIRETISFGLDKAENNAIQLGKDMRILLEQYGYKSVACDK